jgi:hypothetical protein
MAIYTGYARDFFPYSYVSHRERNLLHTCSYRGRNLLHSCRKRNLLHSHRERNLFHSCRERNILYRWRERNLLHTVTAGEGITSYSYERDFFPYGYIYRVCKRFLSLQLCNRFLPLQLCKRFLSLQLTDVWQSFSPTKSKMAKFVTFATWVAII